MASSWLPLGFLPAPLASESAARVYILWARNHAIETEDDRGAAEAHLYSTIPMHWDQRTGGIPLPLSCWSTYLAVDMIAKTLIVGCDDAIVGILCQTHYVTYMHTRGPAL